MKLSVLALDYDGTIAEFGRLDPEVMKVVVEARAAGVTVLLVTGRVLADLDSLLPDADLFDGIVAENGAVLATGDACLSNLLGDPPRPAFLAALERRGVAFRCGACVVEADASAAPAVLDAIRETELPLAIAFNRSRLMVLPQSISKATGLREMLRVLRLSLHNTVAIGDAENDYEMLACCELGAAVAWGSAALREAADEAVPGRGPADVAPFVRQLLGELRIHSVRPSRRRVRVGTTADGRPFDMTVRGRNVIVAGDSQSGKSWLMGMFCEQLILQRYCVCVVDPEGDYGSLEALPGVVVLHPKDSTEELLDVERLLRYPDTSLVIDLSHMSPPRRLAEVPALLETLNGLRRRSGLPHRIVVDEAHYFLHGPKALDLLDLDFNSYALATYRVSELAPEVLAAANVVLVTKESDPVEAARLHTACGHGLDREAWAATLASLDLREAVLLPGADESHEKLVRFQMGDRVTAHVRHLQKYLSLPVAPARAFVFTGRGQPIGRQASSLAELIAALPELPAEVFLGHLAHGDFRRWIAHTFNDPPLAAEIERIEEAHRAGERQGLVEALTDAIRKRYA